MYFDYSLNGNLYIIVETDGNKNCNEMIRTSRTGVLSQHIQHNDTI